MLSFTSQPLLNNVLTTYLPGDCTNFVSFFVCSLFQVNSVFPKAFNTIDGLPHVSVSFPVVLINEMLWLEPPALICNVSVKIQFCLSFTVIQYLPGAEKVF